MFVTFCNPSLVLPQVQLVCPGTAKMEAQAKREPRESPETPALTASLDPRGLRVNATPASAPITPVWRKDPTPKMSRGLKERPDYKEPGCIYELPSV